MIEEYVLLEAVRDYVDESGVYEIVCAENGRVYIGQSTSIAKRVNQHLNDLTNDRHSNALLQHDWNDLGAQHFQFRMVQAIPYTEVAELVRAERKEIRLRRQHGIHLYNDFRLTTRFDPENEEESVVALEHERRKVRRERESLERKEQKINNALGNSEYTRPPAKSRRTYDEVTCYDCGAAGGLYDKHFKCPDKMIRCESCIDDYLGNQDTWIESKPLATGKIGQACMRWQMFSDNLEHELRQAITTYVKKYDVRPQKVLTCGRKVRGGKVNGVAVEQGRHVPSGYLDLPVPEVPKEHGQVA